MLLYFKIEKKLTYAENFIAAGSKLTSATRFEVSRIVLQYRH